MDAAHWAGNSYMATRISLVEVPFGTDTFLAYRRQLGNYASALRFLLPIDAGRSWNGSIEQLRLVAKELLDNSR